MQPNVRRKCGLARRSCVHAYYHNGTLALYAEGELPTPCYEVSIERSLLAVEPPHFVLVQCRKPDLVCAEVVTPYSVVQLFAIGSYRKTVTVAHADGQDTVEVVLLREYDASKKISVTKGSELPLPHLIPPSAQSASEAVEATGYSKAHSFDEAFRNALEALPEETPSYPANLVRVSVVEIGAEFGGFVSVDHLFVRVRRE